MMRVLWSAILMILFSGAVALADEAQQNALLDKAYLSKLQGDIRRGINEMASGLKAANEANIGISAQSSYGYDLSNSPTAGCITPLAGGQVRLTGAIPTVAGGGTAANINDNNNATTASWSPGYLIGAPISSRIFAKLDYGSIQTILKIEVKQLTESLYTGTYVGVYYSTDGAAWTQLGSKFTVNQTPTDFSQSGSVTARYVALIADAQDYANVQYTMADINGYVSAPPNNMSLVTASQASDTPVSFAQILLEYDNTNAPVPNTDIVGHVSCGIPTATVTISNASPAIVSHVSHGLSTDDPVSYSGTLPAPLVAGMTYFVKTVIDPNSYSITATPGGLALSTTGSGTATASFRHWAPASFSPITNYSQAGRTVVQSADQGCVDAGTSWAARIKEPTGKPTSIFAFGVTVH